MNRIYYVYISEMEGVRINDTFINKCTETKFLIYLKILTKLRLTLRIVKLFYSCTASTGTLL